MTQRPLVVKIGGGARIDPAPLLQELADHQPVVLVHGFSTDATRLGERLGVPPVFVESPGGHRSRFTDAATLEVVHLAAMTVNDRLVTGLAAQGLRAVGVRAGDAGVEAVHKNVLKVATPEGRVLVKRGDLSGRITGVDPTILGHLLDDGVVPVVAPLARADDGRLASIDGDRCAAAVAAALNARGLVILTGAPGVLRNVDDPATRLDRLHLDAHDENAGFIEGAMKRKVLAAREALEAGVERVLIASASVDAPVTRALKDDATEVVL